MALEKVTYVDGQTIIHAQNLNDIQNEILANGKQVNDMQGWFVDTVTGGEATGSKITFGSMDAVALEGVTANIYPNQSGRGDPTPANIRPITPWESVTLMVNGTENTIQIPNTPGYDGFYGGTLDFDTGKLVMNYTHVPLGVLTWYRNALGTHPVFYDEFAVRADPSTDIRAFCSCFTFDGVKTFQYAQENMQDNHWVICEQTPEAGDGAVVVRCDSYSDAADFRSAFSEQEFAYPQEDSEEYAVTPVTITAQVGKNDISFDAGDVTVSFDGCIEESIDATLSVSGMSADAKATGDALAEKADKSELSEAINDLAKYNSQLLAWDSTDKSTTTTNGVTYSVTNGVATFSGTATSDARANRIGSTTTIPAFLKANTDYYVNIAQTGEKNVTVAIGVYSGGDLVRYLFSSTTSGSFNTGSFTGISGIIIRYLVPKGVTVNGTVRFEILSAPPNSAVNSCPQKVRLMQYNAGKFNMGQSLDGNTHFLTEENVNNVVQAYRRVLGEIQPDVIGIEEWEDSRTVYDSNDQPLETPVSFNNEVFNRLYPFYDDISASSVISKRSVKSKFPIISTEHVTVSCSYEYGGETRSESTRCVFSHIQVGNKTIAVAATAMRSGGGDEDLVIRQAMIPAVLDLLKDEEYAFVICDENTGGADGDRDGTISASVAEGNQIYNSIVAPAGWESAHGSYFPWRATWQRYDNSENYLAIDQIFYKDNGKVVLCGFEDLFDERENLASDHVPVYADFLLL